jgi:hypothetical protein
MDLARGDESKLQALIRMRVACELALESLPKLAPETEEVLRDPIQTLCAVTDRELGRLRVSLASGRDEPPSPSARSESPERE